MNEITESDVDAIFSSFAEAIHAKATVLRRTSLAPTHRARVRESICDDLKKVSNLLTPQVSRAALEEAQKLEIDLFAKTWHDQPSFDEGRELFHLEHVCPVSILRDECCRCPSADDVRRVLTTRMRVAWILKDEDRRLTARGHRSKRPVPDDAYRDAEIVLVSAQERLQNAQASK